MATNDDQPDCRVVYIGPGRRGIFLLPTEDQKKWRERQAAEMEEACREMLRQSLHLTHIVPVKMTNAFAGGSTEGAWLYFATNKAG